MSLKNFQKLLFYLLLFLIPSNLGKHFILPSSYVSGVLVDYLVPTVYLTDVLVLLLLFSWLWSKKISKLKSQNSKPPFGPELKVEGQLKCQSLKNCFLVSVFCFLLINSCLAANQPAAFYKFFKLLELFLLSIYIKRNINIKKDIKKIALVLAGSSIFQSLLALAQWTKDGSVFNNYLFFGEQPYSLSTPGIKKISFQGLIKAPPLGTFPHPNVLAGFLVLTFPIILKGLSLGVLSIAPPRCKIFINLLPKRTLLFTVYGLLFTLCLFLTFSFPAWLAFGIMVLLFVLKSKKSNFIKLLIPLFFLLFFCLIYNSQLATRNSLNPTSLARRQTLNLIAIKMILKNPLTGVGLNNFTYVMENYGQVIGFTRFLQPVHNVYLLILSETGLIGFLIFLYLILKILRNVLKTKKFILHTSYFILLFLLFFDHYLFTTQQGLLLSFIIFGLF